MNENVWNDISLSSAFYADTTKQPNLSTMKFIIAFAALVAIVAAAPAEVPESQAETIKSNVDQAPNGEYTVG